MRLLSPILICIAIFLQTWSSVYAANANDVDLVIEADTIAPAFYYGRHEPTAGSAVHVIAVMEGRTDGFSFRWELNGSVITGNHTEELTFNAPIGDSFRIRVDVFDNAGAHLASSEQVVPLRSPSIVFYPVNLLRGTLHTAIPDSYILTDDEASIRAEPYFMDRGVFDNAHKISWKVNNEPVTDLLTDPQVLTLRRTEGTGSANVAFTLQNGAAIGQRADGSFVVKF